MKWNEDKYIFAFSKKKKSCSTADSYSLGLLDKFQQQENTFNWIISFCTPQKHLVRNIIKSWLSPLFDRDPSNHFKALKKKFIYFKKKIETGLMKQATQDCCHVVSSLFSDQCSWRREHKLMKSGCRFFAAQTACWFMTRHSSGRSKKNLQGSLVVSLSRGGSICFDLHTGCQASSLWPFSEVWIFRNNYTNAAISN